MPDRADRISEVTPCFAWGLCCVCAEGDAMRLHYIAPGLAAVLDGAKAGGDLAELLCPEDRALLGAKAAPGEAFSVSLRLMQKAGGEPLPVHFSGVREGDAYWGIVTPAKGPLSLHAERLQEWFGGFRTLLQSTNQQAYEWDIRTSALREVGYQSVFWREMMRTEPMLLVDKDGLPSDKNIYESDRHAFRQLHESILGGGAGGSIELRMLTGYGIYRWCRLTLTTLFDEDGAPMKAVGLISDIEYEKRAAIALEARAKQDSLTGLLNSVAFRERLPAELTRSAGSVLALCVVQVDGYQQLLSRLGWVEARGLLIHAANRLAALAGPDALTGRLGERTFGVLRRVGGAKQAGVLAKRCCEELRQSAAEGMQKIEVTASVGLALVPKNGIELPELLRRVDLALGKAAALGDATVRYDASLEGGAGAGLRIGGIEDSGAGFDNNLLYTFFEQLYQDEDSDRAVSRVLMMAGEHYNASRGYIYKVDEDDPALCHLMFEWGAEGIEPLRQTERTAELCPPQEETVDGRFLCEAIETLPPAPRRLLKRRGVRTVLQFGIRQNDSLRAVIGFHECKGTRLWNSTEKESLALTAKLLGAFILRVHAQERVHRRDPLTGLPLYGRFRQSAARRLVAQPDAGWQLLFLDVVRFRDINELFGTGVGDLLLMRFARLMRMRLGDGELACRLTSNRYALLLRRRPGLSARDRLEAFQKSFEPTRLSLIGTHSFNLVAGVVDASAELPVDTLLDMARIACKKSEGNRCALHLLRRRAEPNLCAAQKNRGKPAGRAEK